MQGIQLRAVKEHETYNPNMIINESKLTIEVFDGRGFVMKTGQPFEPLIYFFCEKQRYQLDPPAIKGNSFEWGQRVPIPIQHSKSDLLIQVCNVNNPSLPILETSYPIDRLADQVVKSESLRFQYTDGGSQSEAILNCSMQWLYSRAKFYTNIIDMLDRELKTSTEAKKDADDNLRALYGLFPSTANVLPRQVNFASLDRFNDFSPIVSRTEPTLGKSTKGMSPWLKPLMYLCYLFLILALMTSLYKTQFLDICLALMYITSAVTNVPRMNRVMGITYIGLILLSIGLDIIWFCYYASPWWSSNYIDSNSLSSLRGFTIIMVGILWVVKLVVIVMMFFNLQSLPTDKPFQGIGASQWKSTQDGKMVLGSPESPSGGVWGR